MGSPGVVEGTQTMKILLATMDTTERGLLRPSPLPMLLPLLPLMLMLMPGTDTMAMATELMAMVAITGLMATMDTTERGLLKPSLLLRLIPGTDTMAMAMASTDLMAMDTTDTGLMAMDTGERSKKCDFCQTAAN